MKKIYELLQERTSAKLFDLTTPRITDEELFQITEAIRLTPISLGLLSTRIIAIRQGELKDELSKAACVQPNFLTSDVHIAFISSKESRLKDEIIVKSLEQARQLYPDKYLGFEKTINYYMDKFEKDDKMSIDDWQMRQSYISTGSATIAAAQLNIDSITQEGFDQLEFERVLKAHNLLAENEQLSIIMGFGKSALSSNRIKNRLPSEIFTTIVE